MSLAILVPVLNRPHRVEPLLESIRAATPDAHTLFIPDLDDEPEERALDAAIERFGTSFVDYLPHAGNYASKIRVGMAYVSSELLFTGADDLHFQAGWFEAARAKLQNGIEVVGVNDLIPRRRDHQTHFLMTRAYAMQPTIDGELGPFFHGYRHWFCDDELIATAKHRRAYAYAHDAIVEHLHPMAGRAEDDDTYRKGREHWRLDRKRFNRREPLWTPP